jgi:hypothetical protein
VHVVVVDVGRARAAGLADVGGNESGCGHLGGLGWFAGRHPNLAGYHVIGDEATKFMAP